MGFYKNDATPANNTSINGIAIQGLSSPANIDNALRELAAQGKQFALDMGGAGTVGGTADALTLTTNSGIGPEFEGCIVGAVIGTDNATTSPTLNVDGNGAEPIKKAVEGAETALAAGDMQAGTFVWFRWRSAWDSGGGAWELLHAAQTREVIQTLSSLAIVAGDTVYGSAARTMARLAIGTEGQALIASSTPLPSWANRVTRLTAQSASGATVDFTGIPPSARMVVGVMSKASLNASEHIQMQLGDAAGIETTGYTSACARLQDATSVAVLSSTAAFCLRVLSSVVTIDAIFVYFNITGNVWIGGHFGYNSDNFVLVGAGSKTLSDTLTQVRFSATSTAEYDTGSLNVFYM